MAEKTCETCRFWIAQRPSGGHPADGNTGRCRRWPPFAGGWPTTWGDDWCGEYVPSRFELSWAAREAMARGPVVVPSES